MSTANKQPEAPSLNAFKQPKAFYLIFSIELWERFGYYGLQGIMAVYLVKQLGMSEAQSITLFASFSALVYGLVAVGGWLGDKVLGTKRVIVLGTLVLALGYALVAWSGHDEAMVYIGMATIAVGNGLFKANPSSLLSTCYEKMTRVSMARSPCTIWRSTSVPSSLCWPLRGWPINMAGAPPSRCHLSGC